MAETKASLTVTLVDKVSTNAKNVQKSIAGIASEIKKLAGTGAGRNGLGQFTPGSGLLGQINVTKKAIGSFGGELSRSLGAAAKFGAGMVAAAGVAGYAFKTQFIDTAAEFERLKTVLTTIEGSSDRASKALDWVTEFAAKTPYEMGQVSEAFVQLRAYGLNPMDGTLKTLGDTASAMGKPLGQAVEALADAVTGENERLKEFGIKARAQGANFVYEYSQNGKTVTKIARKNSREQIQATLQAIWNEKYAGAMDDQSRTWNGMVSNLMDQWTKFKLTVMQSGVFDFMKSRLAAMLERIDAMAKSGELQAWAKRVGDALMEAGRRVEAVVKDIWANRAQIIDAFKQVGGAIVTVKDLLGGWGNLVKAIAVGSQARLIGSFVSMGIELGRLGVEIAKILPRLAALTTAKGALAAAEGAGTAAGTAGAGGLLARIGAGAAGLIGTTAAVGAGTVVAGVGAGLVGGGYLGTLLDEKIGHGKAIAEWLLPSSDLHGETRSTRGAAIAPRGLQPVGAPLVPTGRAMPVVGGELTVRVKTDPGTRASVEKLKSKPNTQLETEINNGASTRSY